MTRGRGLCAWILVAGAVWTAPASGATGWTTPFDLDINVWGTAMAPDGTSVAWGGLPSPGGPQLAVQVRPPGGSPLDPQILAQDGGRQIDLAVAPDGGFMAAWTRAG